MTPSSWLPDELFQFLEHLLKMTANLHVEVESLSEALKEAVPSFEASYKKSHKVREKEIGQQYASMLVLLHQAQQKNHD